jgi:NAD(P)-dependent dehydrogenase (short-subunit alcohol dehydrogenase family)
VLIEQEPTIARLEGKTAIVTGGTSGLGRSIVERFAAEGARVLFTGRNEERAAAVVKATGAKFVSADAAKPDHAARIAEAAQTFGDRIDILVNNAGGQKIFEATNGRPDMQGIENFQPEWLDQAVAMHLRSPWELMSRLIPAMKRGGSIINMSSIAGHRVGATSVAYAVAKAAMLHLTRCAASELGQRGIRVNSVSPGLIATPAGAAALGAESPAAGLSLITKFTSRQALQRPGRTTDVAGMAVFLASDEAAFVTGSDFVVDGGILWGRSDMLSG